MCPDIWDLSDNLSSYFTLYKYNRILLITRSLTCWLRYSDHNFLKADYSWVMDMEMLSSYCPNHSDCCCQFLISWCCSPCSSCWGWGQSRGSHWWWGMETGRVSHIFWPGTDMVTTCYHCTNIGSCSHHHQLLTWLSSAVKRFLCGPEDIFEKENLCCPLIEPDLWSG